MDFANSKLGIRASCKCDGLNLPESNSIGNNSYIAQCRKQEMQLIVHIILE